jgi:hypothetical protein
MKAILKFDPADQVDVINTFNLVSAQLQSFGYSIIATKVSPDAPADPTPTATDVVPAAAATPAPETPAAPADAPVAVLSRKRFGRIG